MYNMTTNVFQKSSYSGRNNGGFQKNFDSETDMVDLMAIVLHS